MKENSENRLRIAFFNATDRGSGAEALIHNTLKALISRGIDARLYAKICNTGAPYVYSLPRWPGERDVERIFRLISGYEGFLFPSTRTLHWNSWIRNAHLWHFHNLHGDFVSIPLLAAISHRRRVVLSPVDQFLSTGHCAYTIGCIRYRDKCGKCPQLNKRYPGLDRDATSSLLALKKRAIANSKFHLLVHTDYLAQHYASTFANVRPIRQIYYGVDTQVFRPMEKATCATALGIHPPNRFFIGLLHTQVGDQRKGILTILELLRQEAPSFPKQVEVLVVGHSSERARDYATPSMPVTTLPFLKSEQELAMALNLCDVILYPTQAENLSLTCLSALACGVPVVSSDIGGQAEAIQHGVNGFLCEPNKSDELVQRVKQIATDPMLSEHLSIGARKTAITRFDINVYVANLIMYYQDILGDGLHN